MLIALDYDDTYTRDPALWIAFIRQALQRSHTVVIATMRTAGEGHSIDPQLKNLVPIVYTCRKAKRKVLQQQGYQPTIWIDDNPEFIFEDAE